MIFLALKCIFVFYSCDFSSREPTKWQRNREKGENFVFLIIFPIFQYVYKCAYLVFQQNACPFYIQWNALHSSMNKVIFSFFIGIAKYWLYSPHKLHFTYILAILKCYVSVTNFFTKNIIFFTLNIFLIQISKLCKLTSIPYNKHYYKY